jgi:hypothetical protein
MFDLAKDFSAHSGVGVSEVIENSVRQYAGTQYVLGNTGGIDVNVPLRKNRSTTTPSDDLSVMLQWATEVLLAIHPASVALAWNIATFRGAIIATAEEEQQTMTSAALKIYQIPKRSGCGSQNKYLNGSSQIASLVKNSHAELNRVVSLCRESGLREECRVCPARAMCGVAAL